MSTVLLCPNQHGSFQGNKFCTVCGAALIAPPAQASQAPPNQANFTPPQQGFAPSQNMPPPPSPANFPVPKQNFVPNQPPNFAPPQQNFVPPPNAVPPQSPNYPPPPQNTAPPQMPQQNFAPPQNFQPPRNFPAPPYPPPPPNNFVPPQPYPPVQNFPPQPMPPVVGAPIVVGAMPGCFTCGGKGQKLKETEIICPECKWLRPLVPGYSVDCRAFQWASDGVAMSKLRSISSLQKVARTVSDKVGRRWIETTFDAIQIGENQLPEIYEQAILAARILAMEHMPDIYVSGNPAWDATTYGSDTNAFIVIGSALLMNFKADELLFLFAREMGHCRAGHALWKTVLHFLLGSQSTKVEGKSGGILRHLNLTALVTDAVELPLLAWARHSEITADRAGMLALGKESLVRKVLLAWSLKSPVLYDKINIEAWLQQQSSEGEDAMTRVSEMVTSPVPYIARRLKLMSEFSGSNELKQARAIIESSLKQAGELTKPEQPVTTTEPPGEIEKKIAAETSEAKAAAPKQAESEIIKIACTYCKTAMRIPLTAFADKESLNVRCPNKACAKILAIKRKSTTTPAA